MDFEQPLLGCPERENTFPLPHDAVRAHHLLCPSPTAFYIVSAVSKEGVSDCCSLPFVANRQHIPTPLLSFLISVSLENTAVWGEHEIAKVLKLSLDARTFNLQYRSCIQ